MKKNEKIRTPLGIISVFKNEIPERYHCAAEPEILRISETHIRIRTIDQAYPGEKKCIHQDFIRTV